MTYIAKTKIGNTTYPIGSALYGTCDTAANTANKTVTLSDFDTLITGVTLHVKFTNSNTAANPKLIVGTEGQAKSIYRYGTTVPGTTAATSWPAGAVVSFTYTGDAWIMNDWNNTDTNTHYTNKLVTSATSTGTSNETVSSGTNSVYLNLLENGSVAADSAHEIKGTGTVSVASNGGAITIDGKPAVVVNNDPTLAWGTKSTIGTIDGANLSVTMPANPGAWYGTSSTAAGTDAKTVTCSGFVLTTGTIIGVLFSTANTAATPTLNVNSTGAKTIYIGGNTALNATSNVLKWSANTMVYFMYDGTYYRYITSVSAGTVASSRGAGTWYGTSSTAAGTAAKTSTIANYVLTVGAVVSITFSTANTAGAITLNVNSTGAKDISYNGSVTSTTNQLLWDAGETVTFIYSGSAYCFVAKSKNSSATLNGVKTATPSFYAPTTAGDEGQFLISSGSGEPTWGPIVASIEDMNTMLDGLGIVLAPNVDGSTWVLQSQQAQ